MALNNFIPQIWSAQLLASLRKSLVIGQEGVVNKNYEGDITGFGSSVRINGIGAITIGNYVKNTNIADAETLNDTTQVLLIDQQKYFNFQIDDIDKAQQNPKVMAQAMSDAAYGLRDKADQYLASLITLDGAGEQAENVTTLGGATGFDLSTANAYDILVDAKIKLDKQNVPTEGRYVVVTPEFHGKLLKDNNFIGTGSALADGVLRNGLVGRAAGFDIYSSNNIQTSVEAGSTVNNLFGGYSGGISFAEQIMSVEAYRPEGRFADAMKGLYVYGGRIVRPEGLVRIKVLT
jgi:hypothetical protein